MTDLSVENITRRFGGLTALSDVSIHASGGRITALIGPNGAGKSTLFDVCAGTLRPESGTVRLGDRLLGHASPSQRAAWGLGRTFQRLALFDALTVADNVALGLEARLAGRRPLRQFVGRRGDARCIRTTAEAAMHTCGITHLAAATAGELSTGDQRLVELARVIAGGFEFLLLDEPSSGLDDAETDLVAGVLEAQADGGVGILLVEHDVALVRQVATTVHVLDAGEVLASGPTTAVLESEAVRTAYVGAA